MSHALNRALLLTDVRLCGADCSAFIVVPHTQGAQERITQCYLQLHQCLPLPSKGSLVWCLPRLRLWTSNCSLLLIYLPRKDEKLSRPGWLTYSGRFTHISGHPSAAGRAQDRESSPVEDRRSTTVPRNQLCRRIDCFMLSASNGKSAFTKVKS